MLIHKFIHILISLKYRLCPKFSGGKDGGAHLLKESTQVTRNYTMHLKREGTSHLYL